MITDFDKVNESLDNMGHNGFLTIAINQASSHQVHQYIKRAGLPTARRFVFDPQNLSESASANWEETTTMGRWEPYISYSGTSSRDFTVELELHATDDAYMDVVEPARWLQGLQYPIYLGNLVFRPPSLALIWAPNVPYVEIEANTPNSIGRLLNASCVYSSLCTVAGTLCT
jgi:hypothetical protein